jgi:hypothetical protein
MKKIFLLSTSVAFIISMLVFTAAPVFAADLTITLKPGATTTIPAQFWCLDFGKDYPPNVIVGVTERAPDGVIAVLETAIATGAISTNPYQTQLAIWRVNTGKFNDYGQKGTVLAESVYTQSLSYAVSPIPAGQQTLTDLVNSGILTVTVAGFSAQKDAMNPGLTGPDFFGKGSLVITNISQQTVTFLVLQGGVFTPPAGVDAQSVIAQYDVPTPPKLPVTGSDLSSESAATALLAGISGILSVAVAAVVLRRVRAV